MGRNDCDKIIDIVSEKDVTMKTYKRITKIFLLLLFVASFAAGCSNIPQDPTKTPTMSEEEMMQAAQGTAAAILSITQTQDAILHPSATPLPTATPAPIFTATSSMPQIPPTATAETLPYYSVGNKSCYVQQVGGGVLSAYVPFDKLYLEVCYENQGSGTWNSNFYCQVVVNDGGSTSPLSVPLGKTVTNGQKACFSFNQNMAGHELGSHCSTFALTDDSGNILTNGYRNCCWTVE
jgi:hypothetical protein